MEAGAERQFGPTIAELAEELDCLVPWYGLKDSREGKGELTQELQDVLNKAGSWMMAAADSHGGCL